MRTGADGIAVMHAYEQCRLQAYADPQSPMMKAKRKGDPMWMSLSPEPVTIGWGITRKGLKLGDTCTQAEADGEFAKRLVQEFEPAVNRAVQVPLLQNQFDALVSWAYNVGVDALRHSTLIARLNAGFTAAASAQFLVWNRSGGEVVLGLRRRRATEKALFDGIPVDRAIALGQAVT